MMPERQLQGAEKFLDCDVISADGKRVGIASRIIEGRVNEIPAWIVVDSGLLNRKHTIVPIAGAELRDDQVFSPFASEVIEAQPQVGDGDIVSAEDEEALNRHFGLGPYGPPAMADTAG
jgi:hypothetical protein